MLLHALLILASSTETTPAQDSASAELLRLVKEDQDDRGFVLKGNGKPTKEQSQAMQAHDLERFNRTNQILDTAKTLTVEGLDAAGLLMQHGTDLESYVRAHELSACASLLGKQGSLVAAAEDRYLMNLKRKQRFGSQFVGFGDKATLYDTDEAPPTAVTAYLRRLYFEPPLDVAKKEGFMAAYKTAGAEFIETMTHRMDPEWIRQHSDSAISAELAGLPITEESIARVLALYNQDRLISDPDFFNAARVLASSSNSDTLLLAHELATLALKEGYRPARVLFESTWDKFEESIGNRPRYSRRAEPPSVRAVLEDN